MAIRRIADEDDATEINLSPMIDCIFILLIFFIVTTVFVEEQGVQVDKPDAAATVPLEEKESVVIEVTAENKVLVDGRDVAFADLSATVKSKVSDPSTPVVIRAHEKTSHAAFVSAWDAARRGGAETLSFSTVN